MVGSTWPGTSRTRSPTRPRRRERDVLVGAEPHLGPGDVRVAVVHAQGLEPGSRRPPTRGWPRSRWPARTAAWLERQAEAAVGGVHQRVGAGLDLGGPGVAGRRCRSRRPRCRSPPTSSCAATRAAPWPRWHCCARSARPPGPRRGPRSPSPRAPPGRRRAARSASRPASPGSQPHRGRPTLTSMSTSRTPPAAAASMVCGESTATVTRAPARDQGAEPGGVEHLVGQQQVLAEARPRPCPRTSRMVAQVKSGVPGGGLAAGQAGALVRLDVRPQALRRAARRPSRRCCRPARPGPRSAPAWAGRRSCRGSRPPPWAAGAGRPRRAGRDHVPFGTTDYLPSASGAPPTSPALSRTPPSLVAPSLLRRSSLLAPQESGTRPSSAGFGAAR